MTFVAPSYTLKAFTCPHCGAFSRHKKWGYQITTPSQAVWDEAHVTAAELKISKCDNCAENCLWIRDTFVYPMNGDAPIPNQDMPPEVRADYDEASKIYADSPRGAAALLRLAIQKPMKQQGLPGENIIADIKTLVAAGLPVQIQQALDVVRVTGNNAVHPGQLDANDITVAQQRFPLVNLIVDYQISFPARVSDMYKALPPGALAAIEKRDSLA